MELTLSRVYHPEGVNGDLFNGAELICYTIELPFKDNQLGISCIPEGRYELKKRYSAKYQWHLHLQDVPGRSLILIHPANVAAKELKGCIAPVTTLAGSGRGHSSRSAFRKLNAIVFEALDRSEQVFLSIHAKSMIV